MLESDEEFLFPTELSVHLWVYLYTIRFFNQIFKLQII